MNVPFVDLQVQYSPIRNQIQTAINEVLDSGWFVLGQNVELFEKEFAGYCGCAEAVGVGSGTEALHLALKVCGVGVGDEVITVSHTFIATALAIVWTGATPVFVDIDPVTYTMDVSQAAKVITPRTKAILPVHLYGQCADMDPLLELAQEYGLWVIEDACQAHGATYKGRKAGSLGHLGCFSFYPSKNLGAYGDGGAITTNDKALAQRLRLLRNYGQTRKYHHESMGYNSRLDELQAAILRAKLPYLDTWNEQRRRIAALYRDSIQSEHVTLPGEATWGQHVYHLFVIRSSHRDELQRHLYDHKVQTMIHYPVPVHQQGALATISKQEWHLPETEKLAKEVLSLPMYAEMTEEQVRRVSCVVNDFAPR